MGKRNTLRNFEDALLQQYISKTEPRIKAIDCSSASPDIIISEANRFKRETRKAEKKSKQLLESSQISISSALTKILDLSEKCEHYWVDPSSMIKSLKADIEKGIPFSKEVEKALRVTFDYTPIGAWTKKYIRWQAAAQIHWFEHPGAKLSSIKEEIFGDREWEEFLELSPSPSVDDADSRHRGLEDAIRKVLKRKSGRPSEKTPKKAEVVLIWAVYGDPSEKINGSHLCLVIRAISSLLRMKKKNLQQVRAHPVMAFYVAQIPSLDIFIDIWIREAFEGC